MRAPICEVHMELVGVRGDVTRFQAIVFEALVFHATRPNKNEYNANDKKDIR